MKRFVCMIGVSCIAVCSFAQSWTYQTLRVTTNKTTTLIFPAAVQRGDIGSGEVLAQQVKENENILFLKAAKPDFAETNLNVVTADGRLYTFTVAYDSMPGRTVYNIASSEAANKNEIMFPSGGLNPATIEKTAREILYAKHAMHGIKDSNGDVVAVVSGIYIKENILFFRITVENLSAINYDIDFVRFSILDNKVSKRTATQEQEIKPARMVGGTKKVKAGGKATAVFAFEKFTIPDKKSFIIQIGEKNGGRHLQLRLKNRRLVKATAIQ